jgi:hypothetical protein
MMSLVASIAAILLVTTPQGVLSFASLHGGVPSSARFAAAPLSDEPFFEMQQIPTATTGAKLDRIVDCAEHDGCDVGEMMAMIDGTCRVLGVTAAITLDMKYPSQHNDSLVTLCLQFYIELERLNMECEGTMSRECNLDAVAARNVLKVALASKVAMEEALKGLQEYEDECMMDPYLSMHEMHDECMDKQHPIPTSTTTKSELHRMMQCAQNGEECDVSEMMDMIDELERLNMECEGALSRECSLQAVEARNILKVALASQAAAENAILRAGKSNGFT